MMNIRKVIIPAQIGLEKVGRMLRDSVVVQKNSAVMFVTAVFVVAIICVTAAHYIRSESHYAFRFGGGETLIEGASNGCEPKDIIALGDELSSDTLISALNANPKNLDKYPELKKSMEQFNMFTMLIKMSSTMRSKPDEQMIRKTFSDMASKKELDCKMNNLLKHIDSGPHSADEKSVYKKYATRFEEIGNCLGVCKENKGG
jgi:hypothetical protein